MIGGQYTTKVLQRDDLDLLTEAREIVQEQMDRANDFLQGEPCTDGEDLYDDLNALYDGDADMAEYVVTVLAVVSDEGALQRMQEALRRYREGSA